MDTQTFNRTRDENLWRIAKKRAEFKRHLAAYIIVNSLFWIAVIAAAVRFGHMSYWPVFPTFFWGMGIFFNWYSAYHGDNDSMAQKEYEKLLTNNKNIFS